jgi:hypothetical protein
MRDLIKTNKPNAAKAAHVLTTGIALVSAAVAISLPNPKATTQQKNQTTDRVSEAVELKCQLCV